MTTPDMDKQRNYLAARVASLERVLRDMLAYFVDDSGDPSESDLRDPDFWEGSYKSAPSKEYLDYWKVVDAARALLTEDRPAVTEEEPK